MPHLVILYTPNLEPEADMSALCRALANTMLAAQDEQGHNVFPPGGTRVLAYPAAHFAVSDDGSAGRAAGGTGEYGFVYLNLRMGKGRTEATQRAVGDALLACAQRLLKPLFENRQRKVGLTLQIDVGQEVYDGKISSLHPLFSRRAIH